MFVIYIVCDLILIDINENNNILKCILCYFWFVYGVGWYWVFYFLMGGILGLGVKVVIE